MIFMVHYEIERRVDLRLKDKLPSDARLERVYGGTDTYFTIDPFLRVRNMQLTYPSPPRSIQRLGLKKIIDDGEVEETETPVDAVTALKILNDSIGKPKVILDGHREEYSLRGLTVCVDNVKGLGDWTEIEKISSSKDQNGSALNEVIKAFESLGVKENQLTKEIYPVLLYKKQQGK
jgi:predicted adenylyl cyclase CyaB